MRLQDLFGLFKKTFYLQALFFPQIVASSTKTPTGSTSSHDLACFQSPPSALVIHPAFSSLHAQTKNRIHVDNELFLALLKLGKCQQPVTKHLKNTVLDTLQKLHLLTIDEVEFAIQSEVNFEIFYEKTDALSTAKYQSHNHTIRISLAPEPKTAIVRKGFDLNSLTRRNLAHELHHCIVVSTNSKQDCDPRAYTQEDADSQFVPKSIKHLNNLFEQYKTNILFLKKLTQKSSSKEEARLAKLAEIEKGLSNYEPCIHSTTQIGLSYPYSTETLRGIISALDQGTEYFMHDIFGKPLYVQALHEYEDGTLKFFGYRVSASKSKLTHFIYDFENIESTVHSPAYEKIYEDKSEEVKKNMLDAEKDAFVSEFHSSLNDSIFNTFFGNTTESHTRNMKKSQCPIANQWSEKRKNEKNNGNQNSEQQNFKMEL